MILEIPGTLQLPTEPAGLEIAATQWSSCHVNAILVVLAAVLFLALLDDLARLFPTLCDCVVRWKGNVSIQHSVSLSRERNLIAMFCMLPFCLMVDKYGLYSPDFMGQVPAQWRTAICFGVLCAYLLVRRLLYYRAGIKLPQETNLSSLHTPYNIFILLVCLEVLTSLFVEASGIQDASAKNILLAETALAFLLSTVRIGQILKFHCSGFVTFLYLCALEFLPLALLIISAVAA